MKNNYPTTRKPAKKKPCPHCGEWFHARGLHRHILEKHTSRLTPSVPHLRTEPQFPLTNSLSTDREKLAISGRKPFHKVKESEPIEIFENCRENLKQVVFKVLNSFGVGYRFGKTDLLNVIGRMLIHPGIEMPSFDGKYNFKADICRCAFKEPIYRWIISVEEFTPEEDKTD